MKKFKIRVGTDESLETLKIKFGFLEDTIYFLIIINYFELKHTLPINSAICGRSFFSNVYTKNTN